MAQPQGQQPRVLVVGAGFGGLATMSGLRRTSAGVTLVDRNIYSTFQPLLYQVATGGLNGSDIAYPTRGTSRKYHASFQHGEMTGLDPSARKITLADGSSLDYDYLIIATGVAAAHFGVPGAAEHTQGLYTRKDAIALRDQLMTMLEDLNNEDGDGELAITVAGGGATGVELAGTLAELRNIALASAYPDINRARVQVRLVEMAPVLLAPYKKSLRDYARDQLARRGVDVRLGTEICKVTASHVTLSDGQELRSDITVWAAGVAAPAAAAGWGLPQGRGGRIVTGPDLRVKGQDRIFAIGDIAVIDGQPLPQLAQPALQTGRFAAAQVRRLIAGQETDSFSYHDKGIMATIGSRSAVVQLPAGIRLRGTLAWLAWLGLHLITLLGNRNRISALVNLSWRYLTWSRGGGLIMGDEDPPEASPAAGSRRQNGRGQPPAPGG
ncbi:MAG TPA: NAD(P)/FAD-dependent oxidoreductase [Streptosporangiaceae bacterium]|jgi:NADH dehydrogenase